MEKTYHSGLTINSLNKSPSNSNAPFTYWQFWSGLPVNPFFVVIRGHSWSFLVIRINLACTMTKIIIVRISNVKILTMIIFIVVRMRSIIMVSWAIVPSPS